MPQKDLKGLKQLKAKMLQNEGYQSILENQKETFWSKSKKLDNKKYFNTFFGITAKSQPKNTIKPKRKNMQKSYKIKFISSDE